MLSIGYVPPEVGDETVARRVDVSLTGERPEDVDVPCVAYLSISAYLRDRALLSVNPLDLSSLTMNDGLTLSNNTPQSGVSAARGPVRQQAMAGYEASREVENRVRVTIPMNDPEFKNAVTRLNRDLEADAPLRQDVPRGYYLNVRV